MSLLAGRIRRQPGHFPRNIFKQFRKRRMRLDREQVNCHFRPIGQGNRLIQHDRSVLDVAFVSHKNRLTSSNIVYRPGSKSAKFGIFSRKMRYDSPMPLPQLVRDVVDFVYPGRCAGCGELCDADHFLCPDCRGSLDKLAAAPACRLCAAPIVSDNAPCPWCKNEGIFPFRSIVRLGVFEDPLKKLIHGMKYHRRWWIARHLAERMLLETRVGDLLAEGEVLIPVPLHWSRQIGRGYNQADLLAAVLAHRAHLPVRRAVKRVARTVSQTAIHARAEREANVRGKFKLRLGSNLTNKRVIIVDDVMTTAATLRAVARALRAAKPSSISAIVLAVADPKGRDFTGI